MASTGLRTLVPQSPPANAEQRPRDIVITVATRGEVQINGERVSLAGLPGRLAAIFRARGDQVIFVRGDRELEFRRVAEVIDLTKGAGFQRVALAVVD